MHVTPVTLEGALVRLEPLRLEHAEGLLAAAHDPAIWRYLTIPMPATLAAIHSYMEKMLEAQAAGRELAFTRVTWDSGSSHSQHLSRRWTMRSWHGIWCR